MCLVPANPDISGIGVRIAIYLQNLLGFIPAVWAIWDWEVSDHELESAETQSTTNLVLAFAILISCIVQAFTLGLTSYHATVVLSLSWMNNTNAFIYFLLYVHYKSQGLNPQVPPEWSSWIRHIQGQTKALFTLPTISSLTTAGAQATTHHVSSQTGSPRKDGKGGVKILFRRFALLLGSLHLTLMAALGIWLWSSPRSFGIADASCAVDSAHLAIVGARVPFGSNPLRIVSLAIYGLFVLPGLNLLIPMSAFLGLYLWHHARWVKAKPTAAIPSPTAAMGPIRARITWMYRRAIASPVFAIFVGLGFLLVFNIIFIADIELTLRRNQGIQENDEKEWGFGQILAMLLVSLPLRDVVEMVLARRLRRQEEQIENHKRNAAWNRAILLRDAPGILALVDRGADPNLKTEDDWTALEVATLERNLDAVRRLVEVPYIPLDVTVLFHDGRTAVEVAALNEDSEILEVLLSANADINAINRGGKTALEVAALKPNSRAVLHLIGKMADINLLFSDGRTLLEVAAHEKLWDVVRRLAELGVNLNATFKNDEFGSVLQAACCDEEAFHALLKNGSDPHFQGGKYGPVFHVACALGSPNIVATLLQEGVDPTLEGGEYGTALQAACSRARYSGGHLEIVEMLLEKGADVNFQGGVFGSPLQAACFWGNPEVVHILLEKGADPNLFGRNAQSALYWACIGDQLGAIHNLLDKGADPNLQYDHGPIPLHAASGEQGSFAAVQLLLQRGANPNLLSGERQGTALHEACGLGHEGIAEVLLQYQADPNIRDRFGRTVLDHVRTMSAMQGPPSGEFSSIIALLTRHGAVSDWDDNDQGEKEGGSENEHKEHEDC